MPLLISENTVTVSGVVVVEDAEGLHQHLLKHPDCIMEFTSVEHLHAAVVQVLMAHGRPLPANFFLSPSVTQC